MNINSVMQSAITNTMKIKFHMNMIAIIINLKPVITVIVTTVNVYVTLMEVI